MKLFKHFKKKPIREIPEKVYVNRLQRVVVFLEDGQRLKNATRDPSGLIVGAMKDPAGRSIYVECKGRGWPTIYLGTHELAAATIICTI